ncbi:pyruvate dehydrogenase E2 component (dihydrolipoamide acetyltransferase) [Seinonella peptonophila]|uniref:Dihydrolipoamide acetyltransferase component of pyruvate dehydrogenase complex n=1 Tax=Seinonella peptonophila TaxID=112248 RepID=A0A1M5ALV4_9BACL|nr:dihydrolipoamide acetyltransferase family protein [Seinonella peptonophila]SHF30892.1 pyruvate dehydrogenase E2 component (dihydrolipoamide acetyltransferase) [Seinonella peptonophila]
MSEPYHLPELFGGVSEAQLTRWLITEGEQVENDQPICEIQNDKSIIELPAPHAGKIERFCVAEGEKINVGQILFYFQSIEPKKTLATPSVRRLARQHQVHLEGIKGSGKDGRVLAQDILDRNTDSQPMVKQDGLTPRRMAIAQKVTQSICSKPHVTHFDACNVEGLVQWYQEMKKESISYTPLIMKIVAQVLLDHPSFNAHYDEQEGQVKYFSNVSLGVATHTDQGVIVPVIHRVHEKNVRQLAVELRSLVQRAKNGELNAKQMTGSTFTLSNAGKLGGRGATPIIQSPEVAILATHAIEQRLVIADSGEVIKQWEMNLSLSFDHRVLDGVDAMQFVKTFEGYSCNLPQLLAKLK